MTESAKESMKARTERLQNDPETLETVCAHLANGGALISLCKLWDVRYSDMVMWLNKDDERKKKFIAALDAQQEWAVSRLLQEIRAISFVDIRQIFNDDHSLKPPKEWPEDVAAALAGIEVDEIWDDEIDDDNKKRKVQIGETKKIKLFDKLKALEMLGKDLGRFVNKHEITGKLTLEDLVTGSQKKE